MPKDGSIISLDGQGKPMWLVLELTYRCPLKCVWCNNPLDFEQYGKQELSTEEWKRVMREGRELGSLQLGFTGGEPMLRDDIEELVAYAENLGYYTNLITSGVGLTPERLQVLKKAGLKQIQLSLQSASRELTDELVGATVHDLKIEVARMIKAEGFPMVLNVPVFRQNIGQAEEILAQAEDIGVNYLEFANIQYYNWALLNREELLPTREQLEFAEAAVQAARAPGQADDHLLRHPGLLRGSPQGLHERMGQHPPHHRARRCGAAMPGGARDQGTGIPHRARAQPGLAMERIAAVPEIPRRRLDEGAVPQLRREGKGFRRLPLPGLPAHGGRRQHRSRLRQVPAPPRHRSSHRKRMRAP